MPTDSSDTTLIESLRVARTSDHELLRRLIVTLSRNETDLALAVEGDDDVVVYDTLCRRIRDTLEIAFLVCRGKDNVLKLRELVKSSTDRAVRRTKFIVDKDFDGLRTSAASGDLYVTPTYSIENILVDEAIVRRVLQVEFQCSRDPTGKDLAKALNLYEQRLAEFTREIKSANELIFYARRTKTRLNGIEPNLKSYVDVSLAAVTPKGNLTHFAKLVGLTTLPSEMELAEVRKEFDKLDPLTDWRGKFFLAFLKLFLGHLKEDRCSNSPSAFSEKRKITFDPFSNLLRTLAATSDIPDCFKEFVKTF